MKNVNRFMHLEELQFELPRLDVLSGLGCLMCIYEIDN